MKRKTKQVLKTLALSALGIGAVIGAASGINSLVEKNDSELKTIYPVFEVGGLNETDGKYEKSESTLYTKNAFECQGLEIKLDFDNYIKYQIFYYEADGDFLSASEVISGNEEIEVPLLATHARLELTPNWDEMGEDYDTEKEQVIKWYETTKYSSQIEVKVNKEQDVSTPDLMSSAVTKVGACLTYDSSTQTFNETSFSTGMYSKIDLTGINEFEIIFKEGLAASLDCYFTDVNNGYISKFSVGKGETNISKEVPSGARYIIVNGYTNNIPKVNPLR